MILYTETVKNGMSSDADEKQVQQKAKKEAKRHPF